MKSAAASGESKLKATTVILAVGLTGPVVMGALSELAVSEHSSLREVLEYASLPYSVLEVETVAVLKSKGLVQVVGTLSLEIMDSLK